MTDFPRRDARPLRRPHPPSHRSFAWLTLALLAAVVAAGCNRDVNGKSAAKPPAAPVPPDPVVVQVGGRAVTVQLRATDDGRRRAFADFDKLAPGEGMLLAFAFPRPVHLTRVDVDRDRDLEFAPGVPVTAVGLDAGGTVVSVTPVRTNMARWFSTDAEARYLLLLAADASAKVGDSFTLPARAVEAADAMLVPVQLKGHPFRLEVVATNASRAQGLMWVQRMPPDVGMAFTFRGETEQRFFMRNAVLPLDIVYVAADGRVVSVKPLAPLDERTVASDGPARFAIELNRGTAERIGLRAGDVLTLPPAVTSPAGLE